MKKRIFSFIVAIAMIFSIIGSVPVIAADLSSATTLENGKQYVIVSNGYAMKNNNGSISAVAYNGTPADTTGLLWTAESSGNGYTLRNGNQYLNYTSHSQSAARTPVLSNTSIVWTYSDTYLETNISGTAYCLYYSTSDNPNAFKLYNTRSGNSSHEAFLYEVTTGGNTGNEGGNTSAPTPTPTPSGTSSYIAFTSDIHNTGSASTNGTGANILSNWLPGVANKIGATFDTMGFTGDNGDRSAYGDSYWSKVQTVMDIVASSQYVEDDGFFIDGNHEYINGSQSNNQTNATAQKIKNIGDTKVTDQYVIYCFGAESQNQSFNTSHITALDNYLKTVDSNKPVFVLSHFPIHYYNSRTSTNASALVNVLNKYPNVIFLWGHNHTLSDTYYDEVHLAGTSLPLTSSGSNATINFTYAAAGCMGDDSTAAGVQGEGLVAQVNGSNVTLTYYYRDGSIVGSPATVDVSTGEGGTTTPPGGNTPSNPGTGSTTQTNALENGKSYIIVSNGKALKNNNGSVSAVDYNGTPADTTGLLWTAESNGNGYALKNGNYYLNVSSSGSSWQSSASLSLSTNSGSAWSYNNSNSYLTTSASNSTYYLYYSSQSIFTVSNSTSGNSSREVALYTVSAGTGDGGNEGGGNTGDGGNTNPPSVVTGNYTKVDAPTENGKYVIVADGYALDRSSTSSNNSSSVTYAGYKGTAVTVSGNIITSSVSDTMIWDVESTNGGYYIKANGQYLNAEYSREGDMISNITLENNAETWSYTNNLLGTADNDSDCNLVYYEDYSIFTVRSSYSDTPDNVTFYKVTETGENPNPNPDPEPDPDVPVYTVSGTVTTVNSETDAVTIELVNDEDVVVRSTTVTGNTATYTLNNVVAGEYTLRVSKNANATREYAVTVEEEDVTQDAELRYIGDVNGDGRVNVGDFNDVYDHIFGTVIITDEYALSCADVSGDGSIGTTDTNSIYNHVLGTKYLW